MWQEHSYRCDRGTDPPVSRGFLGCTDLKPMSQPTLYASAEGNCKLNGRTIDLATFATSKL
jgi:hypothetical protein